MYLIQCIKFGTWHGIARVASLSVWFRNKERPRNEILGFGRARHETRAIKCAILRALFDSGSSFFAPKPHLNACYAGQTRNALNISFSFSFFLFLRREKYSWHKEGWVGEFISPLDWVIFLQLFTNVLVPWFCFVLFHVFRDMVDQAKFSR